MITVKYLRHNGIWVGWAEYENGAYFSSGRTLDLLDRNIKNKLYNAKRVPSTQIYMYSKPSELSEVPTEKMTRMFHTKYWNKGVPETATAEVAPESPAAPTYDYYEYKVRDGKLVVYGIIRREINSFDLRKPNTEGGNDGTNEQ